MGYRKRKRKSYRKNGKGGYKTVRVMRGGKRL